MHALGNTCRNATFASPTPLVVTWTFAARTMIVSQADGNAPARFGPTEDGNATPTAAKLPADRVFCRTSPVSRARYRPPTFRSEGTAPVVVSNRVSRIESACAHCVPAGHVF